MKQPPGSASKDRQYRSWRCATTAGPREMTSIPRLIEEPGEMSCGFRLDGFCCAHDSVWLPQRRRSHGAYGAGARRVFALPGDTACECLGAFGRRVELSTSRPCAAP